MRISFRAAAFFFLAVVFLFSFPVSAQFVLPGDGDRDDDGIPDLIDNCLTRANQYQRDTDSDSIGNYCDADFNNDGEVDDTDELILVNVLNGGPADARLLRNLDLNGDGLVDDEDLTILEGLYGEGPSLLDDDEDGVPALADLCPRSRAGAATAFPGCTRLDVMRNPDLLLGNIMRASAQSRGELTGDTRAKRASAYLGKALVDFRKAAEFVREADPCRGERSITQGNSALESAINLLHRTAVEVETSVVDGVESGDASSTAFDSLTYLGHAQQLERALIGSVSAEGAVAEVCAVADTVKNEVSRVSEVLDAEGLIVFESGKTVLLSADVKFDGAILPGYELLINGLDFGDGTAVAAQIETVGAGAVRELLPEDCISLLIAPVQPFAPIADPPYILHAPNGYEVSGQYLLEQGMRFAANDACLSGGGAIEKQYALQLKLNYTDINGGGPQEVMLAWSLNEGDMPIAIPAWLDPATPNVTLKVRKLVYGCDSLGNCLIPKKLGRDELYALDLKPRAAYCTATYERTTFDVNDQVPDDYRTAKVLSADLPDSRVANDAEFFAEGYALCTSSLGAEESCFPAISSIASNQNFAIHNQDFYPVHDYRLPVLHALLASAGSGVYTAAGLRWPHIKGQNNNAPFQYSCALPKTVRDAVNLQGSAGACMSSAANAFYRMPFKDGEGTWKWEQLQANNTAAVKSTHYVNGPNPDAYDIGAGCGAIVRATRSGIVFASVVDSPCQQAGENGKNKCTPAGNGDRCDSNCCTAADNGKISGNRFRVLHQDGTTGMYVHFRPDSQTQVVGDFVQRGQVVGLMGTSGNSSGEHLHFHSEPNLSSLNSNTTLALFEALNPDNTAQLLQCYQPQQGEELRSNNLE